MGLLSLVLARGGGGTDRFEITLKLEHAGWRVATFKYGKNIIEF